MHPLNSFPSRSVTNVPHRLSRDGSRDSKYGGGVFLTADITEARAAPSRNRFSMSDSKAPESDGGRSCENLRKFLMTFNRPPAHRFLTFILVGSIFLGSKFSILMNLQLPFDVENGSGPLCATAYIKRNSKIFFSFAGRTFERSTKI